MKTGKMWVWGLSLLLVVGMCGVSQATTYSITHRNSTATVDTSAGMYSWVVDGTGHLYSQWFYYRVGDNAEQSISNLALVEDESYAAGRVMNLVFEQQGQFQIEVSYLLTGGEIGQPATSDIAETINIRNISGQSLDITFFQYTDFNLNGTPGDDRVTFVNDNVVRQWDPYLVVSETSAIPTPSHRELAYYPALENKLTDGTPDDLADNGGVLVGDVSWAFQWDFAISANQAKMISKDKQLTMVPEPITAVGLLMSIGAVVSGLRKRARKA